MSKSETIIIRVSEELKADLVKLAEKDKRKLSDYVRVQIENMVESVKKKGK